MHTMLVAIGGAVGSAARYLVDGAVYRLLPATFPYGTFVVNVTACLIFGVLMGFSDDRLVVGSRARSLLLIGLVGGYSTFSTLTFETFQLLRGGEWGLAFVNTLGQLAGGLVALWAGFVLGRLLRGGAV
jgi:CrcB protein